ncbi:hypothetical protein K661_02850 [Piscirickettsia salmonis LF-89 = ATCC VR-1361]|nr:hypothetical protein K661_02850 [Piscirickettsia salmonis LF-89 = ATCC VR-1361]
MTEKSSYGATKKQRFQCVYFIICMKICYKGIFFMNFDDLP